jgi:hypothetical protein
MSNLSFSAATGPGRPFRPGCRGRPDSACRRPPRLAERLMRPRRCSSRDGFQGRSTLISVPRVCRFSPSQAASVATTRRISRSLHRRLDVLALDRAKSSPRNRPLLPRPAYTATGSPGIGLGQFRADPVGRVVVLAEDDAAVLQPGLALGAMLGQEVPHRGQLRIAGFGAGQFLDDGLQVTGLRSRQNVLSIASIALAFSSSSPGLSRRSIRSAVLVPRRNWNRSAAGAGSS